MLQYFSGTVRLGGKGGYGIVQQMRTTNRIVGAELTMWQWVMGHGSNGSTTLGGSRKSRVSTRDPLTHFTLHSSGILCDFLLHGKPAKQRQSKLLF